MRLKLFWTLILVALGCTHAFAGERVSLAASPELAILLDLDLLRLEALGGSVLTHPARPTIVQVRELKARGGVDENLCADGTEKRYARVVHGWRHSTITLNAELLRLAFSTDTTFPCKHGSFRQFLTATLWHELGHVWDRAEGISATPAFNALLGSQAALTTSPDAYERKNLREALAVNLEWYLLDEAFACRRPALQKFLSERLGFTPYQESCDLNWNVFTQSAYPEDHNTRAVSIDPARVYEIHYLFAGKGEALMSRWGHSMLRLVVCAPHRSTPGPECLSDVSHHLVISYRASIDTAQINYLDGLSGKYPSLLYLYRFQEILQEYTKLELRELHSLRLPLSEDERDTFLRITLERFWGYQGKYRFVTNNCGTEALRHLIATDDATYGDLSSLTPLKLYRELSGMSGTVTSYPSQHEQLMMAFERVSKAGVTSFKEFTEFAKAPAHQRLAEYRTITRPLTRALLVDLNYLERYVSAKTQLSLLKEAKIPETYQLLVRKPWEIVRDVYGVPSLESFDQQLNSYRRDRAQIPLPTLEDLFPANSYQQERKEIQALKDLSHFIQQRFHDLDQETL
ncbi:MAG: DUF4105 domain-containing protein [Bacteriovoracia bacterium]